MSGPIPNLDATTCSMVIVLLATGLFTHKEIARGLDVPVPTVAAVARDEKGLLMAMHAGWWEKRLGVGA